MAAETAVQAPVATRSEETWRPNIIGYVARAAVYVALGWFVLFYLRATEERAGRASDAVIYAIVALSLNIIIGYTGQLSLGHQGLFGVGAFSAAYFVTVHKVPFAATFILSALIAATAAVLLGLVALRITGLYLALITLVFGLTLPESLFSVNALTNGGAGQPADRPEMFFTLNRFYLLCLGFLAVVVLIDWRITRTKTGRALLALRENERVAAAFGINVTAFKLLAFTLSGAIAGVAGALFAYSRGNVTGNDFDFFLGLTFVLMTVVGGLNSRVGVILGAGLFASLSYWFERIPWVHTGVKAVFGEERIQFAAQLIGALGLLLTVIFNPGGIGQQVSPFTRWLGGKKLSFKHDKDAGPGTVEGSSVRA
jgi:branched-chain amino acid transport system permease protein